MKNSNPRSRRFLTILCLSVAFTIAVVEPRISVAQTAATEPAKPSKADSKKAERIKPTRATPPAQPIAKRAPKYTHAENRSSELNMRAWLGVEPVEIDEAVRDYLELTEGFGVAIHHVVSGSPAEKAGLQEKDILLRLDDQLLTTPRHLQVLVATYQKGDVIELAILRKGKESVLKATLDENELPPLSMLPEEPAQFDIIDPSIPNVEPMLQTGVPMLVLPDGGVPRIARLGQDELQQRIATYRSEMQAWMKLPSSTRGPSPTLDLQSPKAAAKNARPATAQAPNGEAGEKKNKVEINAGGVKITGAPSITIGHGASIRAGGGVVKINNANGSVSVKTVDEKPVIEIRNGAGKLIHSGPYERSDDMIEKLPEDAQAVLKEMNLSNLSLLNIQVGGQ